MKRKEKERVDVIFRGALEDFLRDSGKYDDFVKGKIKCAICKSTVSFSNLAFILFSERNGLLFICDNPVCLEKLSEFKEVGDD